jgi:hypothetical protein
MAGPGYHLLQSPTSCSTPKGKSEMTIKQAAQSALDVQNACNPSGVIHSLAEIVKDVLWPEAIRLGKGSRWVGQHPIVTMYLLKLSEMNGCGSTLHESYEPAEKACQELAAPCRFCNDSGEVLITSGAMELAREPRRGDESPCPVCAPKLHEIQQ